MYINQTMNIEWKLNPQLNPQLKALKDFTLDILEYDVRNEKIEKRIDECNISC